LTGNVNHEPRQFLGHPEAQVIWLKAYEMISAMAINGFPINDLLETGHVFGGHECCQSVPHSIMLRGDVAAIVTKAHHVISDLVLENHSRTHDRTLRNLIVALETELRLIDGRAGSNGRRFFPTMWRTTC
jgi:hypothetical protein